VLISPVDLASLEETLDLLSDRKAIKDFETPSAPSLLADIVRGIDAVRKLRDG
jgi:antitoxin YefM